MIATIVGAAMSVAAAVEPAPAPPPPYTVADVIGRNPDDVCISAYRSGHWSDWLEADAAQHRSGRSLRSSMQHYCDGFIHGMKYKGE